MNAYSLPPSSVQQFDVEDTIQQRLYPDGNQSGISTHHKRKSNAGDCVNGDRSNIINKDFQQESPSIAKSPLGDDTIPAARAGQLPSAWHMLCNKKVWSNQDDRQHSDLPQPKLASNDEQQSTSSLSSGDTQRFSDLDSYSTIADEESELQTNSNQHKRSGKRLSRSSDNQNKRASSFTCNRKNAGPVGKHDGFGQKQERDRVIKTDEIALFMRCKTRYSRPDFKPIPPSPGGWDQVKPERVIDWGQTADECSSYLSKYERTHDVSRASWRNVPWLRDIDSSSTASTSLSSSSANNSEAANKHEDKTKQTTTHASSKETIAEKKSDKRIRPPPLLPALSTKANSKQDAAAKIFEHEFDVTQRLPKSANDSINNPLAHNSQENGLNLQNIWRQDKDRSFDTQSSTYRRLSTGTDYIQRTYTPWTAPIIPSTNKNHTKEWLPNTTSTTATASVQRQEWPSGFTLWPPIATKQQCTQTAAGAPPDPRSNDVLHGDGWNSADPNSTHQWEDRFSSILKVVDDDSSMSSMPPTPTESDIWPQPLRSYPARDFNKRRSSTMGAQHRRWTLGSGHERNSINFVMANTQLLQNIVQIGSIGCRHCGSGAHSIARDCPFIPTVTPREAWLQLVRAANSDNIPLFFDALNAYSKCCPTETLQSVAWNLLEIGCSLHLVAMDIALTSTTMLVDLQGKSQRRYTVYAATSPIQFNGAWQCAIPCYPYGRKPGLPHSFEQNLQRLADAGFPRDLTDVGQCKACRQKGHWAKDCPSFSQQQHSLPPPPATAAVSSTSTSPCIWQHHPSIWLNNAVPGERMISGTLNGSSMDYTNGTNFSSDQSNPIITKRRSITQSNSKEAAHRLYYSLSDYVLVDGI